MTPLLNRQSFDKIARGGARKELARNTQREKIVDASPFRGRSSFSTKEFGRWIKSRKAWESMGHTRLSKKERLGLGQRLSDPKLVGKFFEKGRREPQMIEKQLKLGKYGKFGSLSRKERKLTEKLYKGFFGGK